MAQTFYALKVRDTDKVFPDLGSFSSYTRSEPMSVSDPKFKPRLFAKPRHARRALTSWRKGHQSLVVERSYDVLSGPDDHWRRDVEPIEGREALEVDVVEVTLDFGRRI